MLQTIDRFTVISPAQLRYQAAQLQRQAQAMRKQARDIELDDELRELVAQADLWLAENANCFWHHNPHAERIQQIESELGI